MSDAKQVIVGGVPILLKDEEARSSIGNLSNLNTTAKTNLVAAINEAAQSGSGEGSDPEAVKYTSQDLTTEQKTQARTNIGAADASKEFSSVSVLVFPTTGIPSANGTVANGALSLEFSGLKGETGETGAQGIQGIQGPPGITSAIASADANTGVPSVEVSIANGVATFVFHNLKGEQGNTGSSVAYPFTLVNNVSDGGTTAALTAEMGKRLNELIVGGTVDQQISTSGYSPLGYFIANTNVWYNETGNPTDSIAIPLHEIDNIKVTMSGGGGYIAFLKSLNNLTVSGNPDFATGYSGRIQFADGDVNTYNIPSDANYLYIQSVNAYGVDMLPRYNITTEVPSSGAIFRGDVVDNLLSNKTNAPLSAKQGAVLKGLIDSAAILADTTILPELEIGALTNYGLDNDVTFHGKKYWRTSRFIKLGRGGTISASVVTNGTSIRFCYYDSDYELIEYHDIEVSSEVTDTPTSGAVYLRVGIDSARPTSSAFDIPHPKLELTGKFAEKWDIPLSRPSSGSFAILVPVTVSNPNTYSGKTATVQDAQTLLSDAGILALPETYTPDGIPTRMIIFCHGAGTNYAHGTSSFPSDALRPELWLSEGYAVMDVEGNPYNDEDEHVYNPTARQSYIAAYEFVTRKYNIKKDGILLGGSSMGGGMCFDLLLSTIPIIAACPSVPAVNTMWWWEYMNASRRQFVAQKMGFTGTAPTWTNNHPMSSAEWQYLQDNYDKFIRYSPFFALMPDTPSKGEIFSIGNISNDADSEIEDELYATRHFKCKAPVKIFAAEDDATVNNHRNCDLVYSMMVRSAQIVELRYFPTGGHHYALESQNIYASYTNSHGVVLANVPIAYVEMLAFWRRYEQGL